MSCDSVTVHMLYLIQVNHRHAQGHSYVFKPDELSPAIITYYIASRIPLAVVHISSNNAGEQEKKTKKQNQRKYDRQSCCDLVEIFVSCSCSMIILRKIKEHLHTVEEL